MSRAPTALRTPLRTNPAGSPRERIAGRRTVAGQVVSVAHILGRHVPLAAMLVSQSGVGVGDGLADGRCAESKLLADHGEGLAVGVELYRPFGKTGCQLVAGSQRDTTTTQMAGDCVTVGAEATGQLVRR